MKIINTILMIAIIIAVATITKFALEGGSNVLPTMFVGALLYAGFLITYFLENRDYSVLEQIEVAAVSVLFLPVGFLVTFGYYIVTKDVSNIMTIVGLFPVPLLIAIYLFHLRDNHSYNPTTLLLN